MEIMTLNALGKTPSVAHLLNISAGKLTCVPAETSAWQIRKGASVSF